MIVNTEQQAKLHKVVSDCVTAFDFIDHSFPFRLLRQASMVAAHIPEVKEYPRTTTTRFVGYCRNCSIEIMLTVGSFPMRTYTHYDLFFNRERSFNLVLDRTFIKDLGFRTHSNGFTIPICKKFEAFV
jgi:hypothetical protein